jgi:IS5 family transposase
MMFKILVIKMLYDLSDDQAEYQITDRQSFRDFLGLPGGGRVPDAKTVWLFGERLSAKGGARRLFERFNAFLERSGVIVKTGVIVDASFVEAPRQRNSREENERIKSGAGAELWPGLPHKKSQKDVDARWTKKNGSATSATRTTRKWTRAANWSRTAP